MYWIRHPPLRYFPLMVSCVGVYVCVVFVVRRGQKTCVRLQEKNGAPENSIEVMGSGANSFG